MPMELRHLEQIVAICQSGGLSGASRRLQISQPTLSKSISRLERELGVQLFDRSNGAARPTALGEFVAERAETLLHSAAALGREIQHHIRGEGGRLTIGVGPATRLKPLPQIIRRIVGAYPGLRIETRQVEGPAVARGVAEGLYDIAIGNRENAEPYGDLIRINLFSDTTAAFVRREHPLAGARDVEPAALLDYPWASFRLGDGLIRLLGAEGAKRQETLLAFQSDDAALLKEQVLSSHAIGWLPRFVFEEELQRGEVVRVEGKGLEFPFECWMLTTAGHWTSPVIRAIAEFGRTRSSA